MKNLLLGVFSILCWTPLFSQKDYKWERIDSIGKTKDELYSATKMFIAVEWKSAKDVIQNDDKEAGLIMIKGLYSVSETGFMGALYTYNYSYNVTFRFKDGKYKMNIDNVYCAKSTDLIGGRVYDGYALQPFEPGNEPDASGWDIVCPPKKWPIIMNKLKTNLETTVYDYSNYLKSAKSSNDW
ncbi:MAG: hypothetical protein JWP12_318 [Bacteroidetes bacterium]|nr:hypothetical protein [Bacteroidota bacterium]